MDFKLINKIRLETDDEIDNLSDKTKEMFKMFSSVPNPNDLGNGWHNGTKDFRDLWIEPEDADFEIVEQSQLPLSTEIKTDDSVNDIPDSVGGCFNVCGFLLWPQKVRPKEKCPAIAENRLLAVGMGY